MNMQDKHDGFELGERRAVAGDHRDEPSGEVLLHECCIECGFNLAIAMQVLAWADAHVPAGTPCAAVPKLIENCCRECGIKPDAATTFILWYAENVLPQTGGAGAVPTGDSTMRNVSVIKILEYLKKHPGSISVYAVCYVFNLPLLDDINGHLCPAEFAKQIEVSREAVNKEVLAAQKFFGVPPRPGQRGKGARENMRKARIKQLAS